ncbi:MULTISPECIES: tape measure protein [Nitrosomonas]|uniref:Tape measure domain-containing protein n=1 Tax=Nitrosomonas communis TaxID=44574 RepID=A0A0F7KAN1_9PROT|nr:MULTISPECIES: tape measure protein [Nitrosomonas]AKH37340.1 hypothetical protein AAW31_05200 [Nitrosomonas communis]TYP72750.1 tape measure domain-containing protein [Nitrosomonas communis]UVS62556.1 tape measure protein [Nitrosomonas sp. PLL12]
MVAGFASFQSIKSVADAALDIEKLNNTLQVGLGSVDASNDAMQFLRETSNELGLDLRVSAEQFSRLAAAAKGTALEGQATRDIFEGISKASVSLSLSTDEASGALLAVQQMVSKGKVSLEELSGQLGERLPGALQIAARSMGMTTTELNALVSSGKLTAEELLPKLAAELEKTFGAQSQQAAQGLQAQINRFNTAMFEMKVAIGNTGLIDFLSSGIQLATRLANAMAGVFGSSENLSAFDKHMAGVGSAENLSKIEKQKVKVEELRQKVADIADIKNIPIRGDFFFPQREFDQAREDYQNAIDDLYKMTISANKKIKESAVSTASSANKLTEDMVKRGQKITESVISPSEKYAQTQKELNSLLKAGRITQETYNRALQKAQEEYTKTATVTKTSVSESQRFLDALIKEASQSGLTSTEIKRLEAAKLGVLDVAAPLIDKIEQENQALKAQQIQIDSITKNLQRYQQITESVLTDQEKYDRQVQILSEARNATDGTAISQETYNRALKQAEE